MRPYGVKIIAHPDVADIREMGAKSSVGKFPGRSGAYHGYIRDSAAKAVIRRHWARKARAANKAACKEVSGVGDGK
jgi:hypothetical protein